MTKAVTETVSGRCRWWRYVLGLLAICLLAEGAIRVAALALRRDRAWVLAPGKHATTVYCIGDSFTFGLGVRPEEAYPSRLESLLEQVGTELRVSNLGWPGLSSSNAVYAMSRVIRAGDAALVLLLAGWNVNDEDFKRHREAGHGRVPRAATIEVWLEKSRLYRLVKQAVTLRARTLALDDIEIVPQAPRMELFDFREYQEIAEKNLRRVIDLAREFDVPLVLLNYPYQDLPPNPYSRNEYYHVVFGRTPLTPEDYVIADRGEDEIAIHSVIRSVAEETGTPVIDLHAAFEQSNRSDLFQPDLHHPTAAGHALIARTIFEALDPVRKSGAERSGSSLPPSGAA